MTMIVVFWKIIFNAFNYFHFIFKQAAFDAGVACVEDHANEIHVVTGILAYTVVSMLFYLG